MKNLLAFKASCTLLINSFQGCMAALYYGLFSFVTSYKVCSTLQEREFRPAVPLFLSSPQPFDITVRSIWPNTFDVQDITVLQSFGGFIDMSLVQKPALNFVHFFV